MKIKIFKEKYEKMKFKTIKLPNIVRLAIVAVFAIILLFSVISLANAYQKTTTTQIEVSKFEYNQVGSYNYIAYINESIVYEGKKTLGPGEGIIFRDLTKNINASLTYRLNTNKNSEISGTYKITAQITTDLWIKTYTIVSETPINSSGTFVLFTEQFPIDYLFYENILSQIEAETGVAVSDPMLVIQANIILIIDVDGEIIYETLKPSLSVELGQPQINIEFGSANQGSGEGIPRIEKVTNQDVINERSTWAASTLLFLIFLILSMVFMRSSVELTKTGKSSKKIMKKYKEWIVDVNKEPMKADSDILEVNSFEDLMKISEELGKPVFHYPTDEDNHNYYVLDESITYQYKISSNGKKIKIVKCPDCQTRIECNGISGEIVHVICPKCKKEGDIEI